MGRCVSVVPQVDYIDVLLDAMASQISSPTIVYSTIYSDSDQRNHQSSASLAFVRGIHQWLVNSPHKWPVMRKMFPFDDVIMEGICAGLHMCFLFKPLLLHLMQMCSSRSSTKCLPIAFTVILNAIRRLLTDKSDSKKCVLDSRAFIRKQYQVGFQANSQLSAESVAVWDCATISSWKLYNGYMLVIFFRTSFNIAKNHELTSINHWSASHWYLNYASPMAFAILIGWLSWGLCGCYPWHQGSNTRTFI